MNISTPFLHRPVATTLLTLGIAITGVIAFFLLPVAPLPQVDFPTISVQASLPGASPETMAATVATPLERSLSRIAGVTEMTSASSLGSTRITVQFDLDRNIDGAARDVQAAINAAKSLLPTSLPSNPTYRKVNPAEAPILILALTSDTLSRGQMYDAASTILAQKLSQVKGVGQVNIGGGSLPAVRVELNPTLLNGHKIGIESVRTAIVAANANRPKGAVEEGGRYWQIAANDQANRAKDYLPLIISFRKGATVRLADLGEVVDGMQDLRNTGMYDGRQAVMLTISKQPGANVLETIDRIKGMLEQLKNSIPKSIDLTVVSDRSPTIRASLREVERTMLISIGLVILVVFLFLRNIRSTLIPSVAVPVSLIGTFSVMYLAGYSLDNLSLMALTVATGFVVDDTIVVLENISRHREQGISPFQAALLGTQEVGFTVLSMSLSLVAVFIPILLMGGIVGRLFREFAVTLTTAIMVSLIVSLTTSPVMCAYVLKSENNHQHGRAYRISERFFTALLGHYEHSLHWALRHGRFMMILLLATVCLNVYLYIIVPKGFFPQQDVGQLVGIIQADQSISFQAMRKKLTNIMNIVRQDPAVEHVAGFAGGGQVNTGFIYTVLKPLAVRKIPADRVMARLRPKLAREPGAQLFLQPVQDINIGGRSAGALYQFTLQAEDLAELRSWGLRILEAFRRLPQLVDVNTDAQDKGVQAYVNINLDTAARLGITTALVDATLNDSFGQRQISTIYNPLNQYRVVMEVAPQYSQSDENLRDLYVSVPANAQLPAVATVSSIGPVQSIGPTSALTLPTANPQLPGGATVPLSEVANHHLGNMPLAVNHEGQFAASTISFNLPPGTSLSEAARAIQDTMNRLGVPPSIHGNFRGRAQTFQASLQSQPWLILAALVTIYIVLGVLYESYVHPLTIISTLPSAGVGALLALLLFRTEFSIMALIGVILLIGIVKKNAIMMIDFALDAERKQGKSSEEAIFAACLIRFRPILMTTMAALLGAVPLALSTGNGSELRRPLGISIVGGLIVSQMLTLYTTPVVYLYLDRFRLWCLSLKKNKNGALQAALDNGGIRS